MGCILTCFKKNKKEVSLTEPLNTNNNITKESITSNEDISISVSDNNSNKINENNKDNININNSSNNENEQKEKYDDSNTNYSEKGLNLNENIGDDEPLLLPDSPLICEHEKGSITFTKNGFIKLFEDLWSLDNFKQTYEKDNLLIEIRYEGTPMNSQFYLIRMKYILPKSDLKYNKDKDSIMDYIYDINLRLLWDDAIKLYERYEGTDTAFIICTWGKSPIFFVSERETIEKRFRFVRENSTYTMSTSIPLDLYEPKEGVVRFIDYLNLFKVTDEGENIVFTSLNQVDFKMAIPQMLINMTLPSTSKSWYANIKKFANSIIWDREKKTYERKEEEKEDDDD